MRDKKRYNQYQKEYQRKVQLEKYRQWRIWAIEYLGSKCILCNSIENLEIDHIEAKDKKYPVSSLFSRRKEIQLEELAKCQLLCIDHHQFKTKLMKDIPQTHSKNNNIHGTGYMYIQRKCRCIECVAWRKAYRAGVLKYGDKIDISLINRFR